MPKNVVYSVNCWRLWNKIMSGHKIQSSDFHLQESNVTIGRLPDGSLSPGGGGSPRPSGQGQYSFFYIFRNNFSGNQISIYVLIYWGLLWNYYIFHIFSKISVSFKIPSSQKRQLCDAIYSPLSNNSSLQHWLMSSAHTNFIPLIS
jgi:hypothetical protein